jgi:NPCBM/NEW2 domain-containing protein
MSRPTAGRSGPNYVKIGTIATVIGVLVAVIAVVVQVLMTSSRKPFTSDERPITAMTSPSLSPPASTSTNSSPTTSSQAPLPPSDVATYLDDYAKECGIGIGTGSMTMSGTKYAHAIHQWAGSSTDSLNLSRNARRFQATIGIRDDARSEVQVQFELRGDNGQQLLAPKVLSFGQTQSFDVSVEGMLRITFVATAVSRVWGYASWADARVTGPTKLAC